MSGIPTYVRNDHFIHGASLRKARSLPDKQVRIESTQISGGSREHYFHFLLGYLLPLIHEQETRQLGYFHALDCGPLMTPILDKTLSLLGYDFEIVAKAAIEEPIFLDRWDYEWDCHNAVEKTVQKIKDVWSNESCCEELEHPEHLLLVRSQPDNYYVNGDAEIKGYGTSRREIINWPEIMAYLQANGLRISAYEPGKHSLGCQIRTFEKAKKIIGIRGAEWANIVWSGKLDVLIFDPQPPANTLLSLLKRMSTSYQFHDIGQARCTVDPRLVYDYLTQQDGHAIRV